MSTDEVTDMENSTSADLPPLDAAIVILGPDHTVRVWNPGAESMTGYRLEAFNRLDVTQILAPEKVLQQLLRQARAGGLPRTEQLELTTADGQHLLVAVQCAPLRSLDANEAWLMLVIRPVAAQEWRHPRSRVQVLGRLAGDLAHEIHNPLNAIFLHTDIVEEEARQPTPGEPTQILRSLAIIKAEALRLQALMQDYLFLARLSDLHREPEDLSALLEALMREMRPQLAIRRVTLLLKEPDALGEVALHSRLFRRALFNIIERLIEAIRQDGSLTVHGRRTISHVHLYIEDNENAVPAEAWAALRASLQAMDPEVGVNLGIYVAREIIIAHGGEIAVTDEPGAGKRCTVALPLGTAV